MNRYSVVKDFLTTASDGKKYHTQYYNLDVIISVGYRVKSNRGTQFRIWANSILKEYLLRRYAVSYRLSQVENHIKEHEKILSEHSQKIDFFVRTSLPPVEGVFYNGQIFDAYSFVSELIKTAKRRILLIDNYIDNTVLLTLSKRQDGVSVLIITRKITETLKQDIVRFEQQYSPVEVRESSIYHDRFLIIDETVYHMGASLKDLGKKLFAFSRLNIPYDKIVNL